MNTFPFSILTPSGSIVDGDVAQIEVRSYVGSLGIMADHEPLVAACPAGVVRILQDGEWVRFKTECGILTVDRERATFLTPFAQFAGER
jgi:F-type H+-transporting ATPase subunit epsilon